MRWLRTVFLGSPFPDYLNFHPGCWFISSRSEWLFTKERLEYCCLLTVFQWHEGTEVQWAGTVGHEISLTHIWIRRESPVFNYCPIKSGLSEWVAFENLFQSNNVHFRMETNNRSDKKSDPSKLIHSRREMNHCSILVTSPLKENTYLSFLISWTRISSLLEFSEVSPLLQEGRNRSLQLDRSSSKRIHQAPKTRCEPKSTRQTDSSWTRLCRQSKKKVTN